MFRNCATLCQNYNTGSQQTVKVWQNQVWTIVLWNKGEYKSLLRQTIMAILSSVSLFNCLSVNPHRHQSCMAELLHARLIEMVHRFRLNKFVRGWRTWMIQYYPHVSFIQRKTFGIKVCI